MSTVHAVYENGVFRPTGTIDLPDHSEVVFEPRVLNEEQRLQEAMDAVREILFTSYPSGDPDTAERHNEHQP